MKTIDWYTTYWPKYAQAWGYINMCIALFYFLGAVTLSKNSVMDKLQHLRDRPYPHDAKLKAGAAFFFFGWMMWGIGAKFGHADP